mmetsp:Transcript_640/g.1375  ORF Transcript_640/g.1375 Transcript_640/m.1375 type:complete len:429 (-) Transcript_640:114-1400(-)
MQGHSPLPQAPDLCVHDRLGPLLRREEGHGGRAPSLLVADLDPVSTIRGPVGVGLPLHGRHSTWAVEEKPREAATHYVHFGRMGAISCWVLHPRVFGVVHVHAEPGPPPEGVVPVQLRPVLAVEGLPRVCARYEPIVLGDIGLDCGIAPVAPCEYYPLPRIFERFSICFVEEPLGDEAHAHSRGPGRVGLLNPVQLVGVVGVHRSGQGHLPGHLRHVDQHPHLVVQRTASHQKQIVMEDCGPMPGPSRPWGITAVHPVAAVFCDPYVVGGLGGVPPHEYHVVVHSVPVYIDRIQAVSEARVPGCYGPRLRYVCVLGEEVACEFSLLRPQSSGGRSPHIRHLERLQQRVCGVRSRPAASQPDLAFEYARCVRISSAELNAVRGDQLLPVGATDGSAAAQLRPQQEQQKQWSKMRHVSFSIHWIIDVCDC